ncbi:MAG: ABC transporter ATP-binding protein [Pseudomonadota bacterium]
MAGETLRAEAVERRFGGALVVGGASLSIAAGEAVALVGPSGAGKTTLLQVLGLLDRPTTGRVYVAGVDAWGLSAGARAGIRLTQLGFVFQKNNLLPHLSSVDNVALPAWRYGGNRADARARAVRLLGDLGLAARAHTAARKLSVGEAQRVAVARALVNRPRWVLADEPTGALDSVAAAEVNRAFEHVRLGGSGLLVVTHDAALAGRFDRVITMRDGRLEI